MKRGETKKGRFRGLKGDSFLDLDPSVVKEMTPQEMIEELQIYTRELEAQAAELERTREQAERALKRYSDLFNLTPVGYAIIDKDAAISEANLTISEQLGVDRGCLLNTSFYQYIVKENRDLFYLHLRKILKTKGHQICELRLLRQGEPFHARLDSTYEPPGCRISVIDISDRKKGEKALRESQKALNRAQTVGHTGSWRLDVRRNELLWSDEAHRIFGIPKGTPMTYETFLATVHPEDREYVNQQWQAALRGEPYDIQHRVVVDGAVKWVCERAELEFDNEGVLLGGFGSAQDITELRKAEETLRHSRDTLEIRVKQRTAELLQANRRLKEENEPSDWRGLGWTHCFA